MLTPQIICKGHKSENEPCPKIFLIFLICGSSLLKDRFCHRCDGLLAVAVTVVVTVGDTVGNGVGVDVATGVGISTPSDVRCSLQAVAVARKSMVGVGVCAVPVTKAGRVIGTLCWTGVANEGAVMGMVVLKPSCCMGALVVGVVIVIGVIVNDIVGVWIELGFVVGVSWLIASDVAAIDDWRVARKSGYCSFNVGGV